MKLSIITINYNNKNGLQRTIDSVICQTWKDFEWIIIDGGSTDGSKELIEHYQKYFSFWCSEKDNGIYNAMNKGVFYSHGDYLLFLNSGDCLHNNQVLFQIFRNDINADVIYGDMVLDSSEHSIIAHFPEHLTFHFLLCNSIGHPASLIRTTLLKESGYSEDYRIVSDWYKFIELFRDRKSFRHIDIIIADFDTTGVSSNNLTKADNEREDVLKKILGDKNYSLVKESIAWQSLYTELFICGYLKIMKCKGWRYRLLHIVLRLLNKSCRSTQVESETIWCSRVCNG